MSRPLQIDIGEEQPVIEIPIDMFLDTILSTWIREQRACYQQLDDTFEKYDENHDGLLSLEEFTSALNTSAGTACYATLANDAPAK